MLRRGSRFTIVPGVLLVAAPALATLVDIEPSQDNVLYEDAGGALSNGTGIYLHAGVTSNIGGFDVRRALLQFDVAGNVPDGATIHAATLTLQATREPSGNPGAATFSIHPVTQAWGEGSSDASGQEGTGTASDPNDATWIHTFFNTNTWTTPGGDFSAASATQNIDNPGSYSFSSATVTSDVQGWLDSPGTNFGWILIGDETGTKNARQFASRHHGTVAFRPVLSIDFSEPNDPNGAAGADHYVGHKIKASRIDNNKFPKDYNITLNDASLSDLDGDDPENYKVAKEKSLLNPAEKNDEGEPNDPALHYIRYQIKEAKEGIGPASGGRFPRAAKHISRRWEVSNQFGTLVLDSKKVRSLLLPAAQDPNSAPAPLAADRTHYICYQVKPRKNVDSDQAPGGKFRKDIQAYFADQFDDCARDKDGNVSFPSTAVEGMCLFDLKKPVELCSPAAKTAVADGRETSASITESTATTTDLLLCYQAKLAAKYTNAAAAARAGASVGDRVPKQAKPPKRRLKDGTQIYMAPANNFPSPTQVDSSKPESVCIPTQLTSVTTN